MKPVLEAIQKRWDEYREEINHLIAHASQTGADLDNLPRVRVLVALCSAMELRLAKFWQQFDRDFPRLE